MKEFLAKKNPTRAGLIAMAILLLSVLLVLPGCLRTKSFESHASAEGLMAEAFLPADVTGVFSYSLMNDEQFVAVQAMDGALGEEGKISQTFAENFNKEFEELDGADLSFEGDLMPALGTQFRFVTGARSDAAGTSVSGDADSEAFMIVTLEDPSAMEAALEKLLDAEGFTFKKLSDVDAYVHEENEFYAAVYKDLLMVANKPEALVEMAGMDEDDSLWADEKYQDALARVGEDHLFFSFSGGGVAALESAASLADDAADGAVDGAAEDIAGEALDAAIDLVTSQLMIVRAEADGLRFDIYMNADEEMASAANFAFDFAPSEEAYLFEEVPADGLILYYETFGLKQQVEEERARVAAAGVSGEVPYAAAENFIRSYFAMDFEEEVLSFLDKGYAMTVHQGGGAFPGFSVYVDVSSDVDGAQTLLDKLDEQISGLMLVLEIALPGTVSLGETEIAGQSFNSLEVDLSKLPEEQAAALPSVLTIEPITLAYGLLDDKLLLTTAGVWERTSETILDSSLYESLEGELEGVSNGLFLLDTAGVASFMETWRSLRTQLNLGVSEDTVELETLLNAFVGLIAASEAKELENHISGFVKLKE